MRQLNIPLSDTQYDLFSLWCKEHHKQMTVVVRDSINNLLIGHVSAVLAPTPAPVGRFIPDDPDELPIVRPGRPVTQMKRRVFFCQRHEEEEYQGTCPFCENRNQGI